MCDADVFILLTEKKREKQQILTFHKLESDHLNIIAW